MLIMLLIHCKMQVLCIHITSYLLTVLCFLSCNINFKSFLFSIKLRNKPAQQTQIAILQTVNIACPTGIVQDTTVNTVIPFHVELVMVIVIQELVHLVLSVGMIISWNSTHFFLTVQAETPKMQKFVLRKVWE